MSNRFHPYRPSLHDLADLLALIAFISVIAMMCNAAISAQAATSSSQAQKVKGKSPLFETDEAKGQQTTTQAYANYEIRLDYQATGDANTLKLTDGVTVPLTDTNGKWQHLRIAYEHPLGKAALLSVWQNGKPILTHKAVTGESHEASGDIGLRYVTKADKLPMDRDFTVIAKFQAKKNNGKGTLWSKAAKGKKWTPGGRALYLGDGKLIFDVGWAGAIKTKKKVADGKAHIVAVRQRDEKIEILLDGKLIGSGKLNKQDPTNHVFKVGATGSSFGGDFNGQIHWVKAFAESLNGTEINAAIKGRASPLIRWEASGHQHEAEHEPAATQQFRARPDIPATPKLDAAGKPLPSEPYYHPGLASHIKLIAPSATIRNATIQPLGLIDHARAIRGLDQASFERGKKIYATLCVTCHGTLTQPGSLPTAMVWHAGQFKNGNDPYSMYTTVSSGFGLMMPQPQYTAKQKYDVIHYIREAFVKKNPDQAQYFKVTDDYLANLPTGIHQIDSTNPVSSGSPYKRMNFGPALFWTYQVDKGNIAQKGLAIRLDPVGVEAAGGISKGGAWIVYDHDTMRLAAAWTGEKGSSFVNWRGIAFDGSHGTHTSISGSPHIINPIGPGWGHPKSGTFEDTVRFKAVDGRRFGPLPKDWVQYKGTYYHEDGVAIRYTVGKASVLESPSLLASPTQTVFVRNLQIEARETDMLMRIAPETAAASMVGTGASLIRQNGFHVLKVPAGKKAITLRVLMAKDDQLALDQYAKEIPPLNSLNHLTTGGKTRWPETVTTTIDKTHDDNGFAIERLTLPHKDKNPWASWMRMGGFDFYPDGKRAVICTWLGDVLVVKGIDGSDGGKLTWKRIATGLFQPLGVKIVNNKIYISCRDQLARLHDLNGDEEIDYIESFNNDHQVTEHFHEFAMGLQTDDQGNFYYAKSARHAKPALVPHHGTLLKIAADGSQTDIIANGFRAANGVCVNGDGTFYVTDQEGHWTPKNRINLVKPGGFYGNWMGYHEGLSKDDSAMEEPLIWITNKFDRSPAELMWLKGVNNNWGPLSGSLINLSYGTGKVFVVMPENAGGTMQGAMCALPIPEFPTGVMRGRIHPKDGNLYATGLFAWAGNRRGDGGFYRIKATGKATHMPIAFATSPSGISLTFTEKLDSKAASDPANYEVEVWDLKRSSKYGSKHIDQRKLPINGIKVSASGKQVTLDLGDLKPTRGMSIKCKLKGADGMSFFREIHATVHQVNRE